MCKVLQIPRSTYYYKAKAKPDETELTAAIIDIFKASRNNYGTRKIKVKLKERDIIASRRRDMQNNETGRSGFKLHYSSIPPT